MQVARRIAACAAALASVACGALKPPNDLDHAARTFLGALARHQLDSALALARFEGEPDTVRRVLELGSEFIAPFAIDSAKLVGWNVVTMNDRRGVLTYETHAGPRWALLQVQVVTSGSISRIQGFHWQAMAARLADLNAFSLGGRGVSQYLYLSLAICSLLACIGGAVVAGIRRMGVLWILFCLIGVGRATINWTTGQQAFNPFTIQLLGAGFFRPGLVGPWFVVWSLPLGTILALLRSRAGRRAKPAGGSTVAA